MPISAYHYFNLTYLSKEIPDPFGDEKGEHKWEANNERSTPFHNDDS